MFSQKNVSKKKPWPLGVAFLAGAFFLPEKHVQKKSHGAKRRNRNAKGHKRTLRDAKGAPRQAFWTNKGFHELE